MISLLPKITIFLITFFVYSSHADPKGLKRQQEAQRFGSETKVAVVVGVNTYDTISGLRPLQYAVTDASALKKVLEKQSYSVRLLTNQQANSSYILDAIEQAGKKLSIFIHLNRNMLLVIRKILILSKNLHIQPH